MKRRIERPEDRMLTKLSFYSQERSIVANSPAWPAISAWQRKGFVRLRWDDTKKYCYVMATEAGLDSLSKGRGA